MAGRTRLRRTSTNDGRHHYLKKDIVIEENNIVTRELMSPEQWLLFIKTPVNNRNNLVRDVFNL